jgi:hypothetical protein
MTDMEQGRVVAVGDRIGIHIGTWSRGTAKSREEGEVVVFPRDSSSTHVESGAEVSEILDLSEQVTDTGAAFVLSPVAALAFGVGGRRVLVHRRCCGWSWVESREQFLASRLGGLCDAAGWEAWGSCVGFHTPPHDLWIREMTDPDGLRAEAQAAWEAVEAVL